MIRDLLNYMLAGRIAPAMALELVLLTVASVATYALPIEKYVNEEEPSSLFGL